MFELSARVFEVRLRYLGLILEFDFLGLFLGCLFSYHLPFLSWFILGFFVFKYCCVWYYLWYD